VDQATLFDLILVSSSCGIHDTCACPASIGWGLMAVISCKEVQLVQQLLFMPVSGPGKAVWSDPGEQQWPMCEARLRVLQASDGVCWVRSHARRCIWCSSCVCCRLL
jgi:hypothetical protein